MASVKIGPSFFAKAKNDYSDWVWSWVRELGQNSIDAPGTDSIEFTINYDGANTIASCANNGQPMDRDILVNKFLSIGETGKGFQNGSVGGFGKAKELIAFTHERYEIRTGTLLVVGCGGDYDLTDGLEYVHGTTTTVTMGGDQSTKLESHVKVFCAFAQWGGTVLLNGERLSCDLRKGAPRRDLPFGKVYTNRTFENRLIVRINGIPMFSHYIDFKRCVILELDGSSLDVLTSNRDGLLWSQRKELDNFILELATDKRRALKNSVAQYRHFEGAKLKHLPQSSLNVRDMVAAAGPRAGVVATGVGVASTFSRVSDDAIGIVPISSLPSGGSSYEVDLGPVSQVKESFILKNETDLKIPDYYVPDSPEFSAYSKKLVRMWGRLILQLHRMFKHEAEFSIGFNFDEDSEAQHEVTDRFGRVYYLNPAVVVQQDSSKSKSFRKRFTLLERDRLLAIATHEFTHGLGYARHDDEYSSKLTDLFAVVLKNRKEFTWCFGG